MPIFDNTRHFVVGEPRLRISRVSDHEVLRTVYWNEDANNFRLTYNWVPHEQAPWDEGEGLTAPIYTHVNGVRLHCLLAFEYWHPRFLPQDIDPNITFTEIDFHWIQKAMVGTTYDIEFFPFSMFMEHGTPPIDNFLCRVAPGSPSRRHSEDNAWKWDCNLEVYGKKNRTDWPIA